MKTYKVYLIKTRPENTIVYVGMTSQTLHKRFSQHVFRKKLDPKFYYIHPVSEDLTIQEAVTLEELLITQYKTRENGLNVSPASINGYSNLHSLEQKKKWSEERKGKPFKGRQNRTTSNSEDHNRKISESNSRPIICLNDGRTYKSLRQACTKLGLSESKVSLVCQGKRPHTKGYKFKYL